MKALIKIVTVFSWTLSSLYATDWNIEGAVGVWQSSTKGKINHYGNVDLLGVIVKDLDVTDPMKHESRLQGYGYVNVRHDMTLIPNIGFEYSDVQGAGDLTFFKQSLWPGGTITLHTETSLAITQYDTLLFYALLDGVAGLSLDLGADVKYLETRYQVPDLNVDASAVSWVPMLYVHGRYEFLESGLSLDSDIKYITDGSSTLYDIRAKIYYILPIEAPLQPGLELGYRVQGFDVKGEKSQFLGDLFSEKSDVDVQFEGFYGGVSLQF